MTKLTKRQIKSLDAIDAAFDKILAIFQNVKFDTQDRVFMRTEDINMIRSGGIFKAPRVRINRK